MVVASPLINKETEKEVNNKNSPKNQQMTSDILNCSSGLQQFPAPSNAPVFVPEVFPEAERSRYRRCVCTLIQGELNQNYFSAAGAVCGQSPKSSPRSSPKGKKNGQKDADISQEQALHKFADACTSTTNEHKLPFLEVLTCGNSSRNSQMKKDGKTDTPFYSLSVLIPCNEEMDTKAKVEAYLKNAIDTKTTVFKIFSPNLLEEALLEEMFLSYDKIKDDVSKIHIDDWLAYPHYDIPQKLGKFVLDEDEGSSLLYINAIECSAGAMEMSMIGGKNVSNIAATWIKKNVGLK